MTTTSTPATFQRLRGSAHADAFQGVGDPRARYAEIQVDGLEAICIVEVDTVQVHVQAGETLESFGYFDTETTEHAEAIAEGILAVANRGALTREWLEYHVGKL